MRRLLCVQFWAFVLTLFVLGSCSNSPTLSKVSRIEDLKPTVLLVSFDGFRWDYLAKAATPSLQGLAKQGVRARSLVPVFPSVTFTNHYSLVTGLYAENHGIVANNMFDPATGKRFALSDRRAVESSEWWGGEPLWVTAEKQGQVAGTMFWVGSEAEIRGRRPTYWMRYEAKMSRSERVQKVLSWLDQPVAKRPTFLTLYFEDADSAGHAYGPESDQVKQAIANLDETVGELQAGLKARGVQDKVNLIFVSDHGMTGVPRERIIPLDRYVDVKNLNIVGSGAFLGIHADETLSKRLVRGLRAAHPNVQVYAKNEIPARFHYRNHRRIPSVLLVADEGWYIVPSGAALNLSQINLGTHGYDNQLPNMHGFFLASGPAFRQGLVTPPVESVHIYELICRILSLTPARNDGNIEAVREFLK